MKANAISNEDSSVRVLLIGAPLVIAILILDLSLPLGIATGVLYVAPVLIGLWFPRRRYIFGLAALGTAFVFMGFIASPDGGVPWVVLANRGLSLVAIWSTAVALITFARSEAQTRAIVENMPIAITLKDVKGRFVLTNEVFRRWFGIPDRNYLGKLSEEFLPLDQAIDIHDHDSEVMDKLAIVDKEHELRFADGSIHNVIVTKFPLFDSTDEVIGVCGVSTDISELKSLQNSLEESEDRYARALAGTNDGLWDRNIETNEIYFSPRWYGILGYEEGDLPPRLDTFLDLLHPDDRDRATKATAAHLDDRVPYDLQFRMRCKNGEYLWVRSRGQATWDDDGKPLRMAGCITDISERMRADEALRESEARFRAVVDNSPFAIVLKDAGLRYRLVNKQLESWHGIVEEEVIGKTSHEIHPKELADAFVAQDNEVMKTSSVIESEFEVLSAHGPSRTTAIVKFPILDGEGKTVGIGSIGTDITERKRAETALRRSEERFRLITDAMPALVSYVDAERVYRFVNKSYEKWFSVSSDEILGRHVWDVHGKEGYEELRASIDTVLSGTPVKFDKKIPDTCKGTRWIQGDLIPDFDDHGNVKGYFVSTTDITDLKQSAEELRQSEERFRVFAETASDWFWETDADHRFAWFSDRYAEVGLEANERLGRTRWETTADNDIDTRSWHEHRATLNAHRPFRDFQHSGRARNGGIVHMSVSGAPQFDEENNFTGYRGTGTDITERIETEETLRSTTNLLEATFRSSPIALNVLDIEGRVVHWNPAAEDLFGWSEDEVIGKHLPYVNDPEEIEEFERHIGSLLRNERTKSEETRRRHRNGTAIDISLSIAPLNDADGRYMGGVGLLEDITGRKQVEAALQESEERFRRSFEDAGVGILMVKPDGRFQKVNRAFCDMLGYSEKELLDKTFADVTHPDDLGIGVDLLRAMIAGEQRSVRLEKRYVHKKGHPVWVSLDSTMMRDAKGEPIYSVAHVQDLTAGKLAEQALRESEERFRQLAENIQEIFWMRDQDSMKVLYISSRVSKVWGVDAEYLSERPERFIEAIHPEDRERVAQAFPRQARGDYDVEYRILRPDGGQRWIRDRAFPIHNSDGDVVRLVGIAEDITERKRVENELRSTTETLEAIFEASPIAVVALDLEGRVVKWSPAAESLFGWRENEVVGMVAPYVPERDNTDFMKRVTASSTGDQADAIELRRLRKDGTLVDVRLSTAPWRNASGQFIGVVGLIEDVTERKLAEETLRKLTRAIEQSPVSVLITDGDGVIDYVNPAFSDITGYESEEVIGRNPRLLQSGQTPPETYRAMWDTITSGGVWTGEILNKKKNGDLFWEIATISAITDSDGKITNFVGLKEDISERKQAKAALDESKERFRDFATASSDWFWEMDENLRFSYFSELFSSVAGVEPEGLLGKTCQQSGVEETVDPEIWRKHIDDLENQRPFRNFIHPRTKPNGETVWLSISGTPVVDDTGAFRGYRGTGSDITSRRKADEALRESEAKLSTILDNSPLIIVLKDLEGRFVKINKKWVEIFGVPEKEVLGRTVDDVLGEGLATVVWKAEREVIRTATAITTDYNELLKHDKRHFIGVVFPLYDAAGSISGTCAIATDNTARKQQDEQLRQAQKMEAVGQLTGGVAHDFNNLLAIILGCLEYLEEGLSDSSDQRELVQTALRATERGADLTRQLLTFSRKQPLSPELKNLGMIINSMHGLLRSSVSEAIEIRLHLKDDLRVMIDQGLLETAILNLVLNARDAMPGGGVLTIETANVRPSERDAVSPDPVLSEPHVMIAVSDTGSGIPQEDLERVVEPFFTTKEVGQGSGLGLSMVYGFVKQSGGQVAIESELGKGSTITIYLPRAPERTIETDAEPAEEPMRKGSGEVVLVVEDDADVRALAVRTVSSLGYNVLEASDGPAAIDLVAKSPSLDLLITDIVLPRGMNGRELAIELQRDRTDLKVLYMSGYTENALTRANALHKAIDLIAKPFRRNELARKVREAIEG